MALARIDLRPLVAKAIVARFNANPTHGFFTGVGGRFAFGAAAQGWALPYSVFFFVDASPEDTWTERADDVLVQLSVWAKTASEAMNLASLAYDLFEEQEMVAAGLIPFRLVRDTPVPTMPDPDSTTVLWQSGICLTGIVQAV